jgi:hypothetical protein
MRANVRLLAALLLGVLIAATLLATAPIYARAMADTGIAFAIAHRLGAPPITQITTYEQGFPLGTSDARAVQDAVGKRVQQRTGWFTKSSARYFKTPGLTLGQPGQPLQQGDARTTVFVQAIDGFEQHVKVTDGALPNAVPAPAPGSAPPELPIAVSASAAGYANLHVGDHILLGDTFDDCERHPPRMDQPPDPPCTPHTTVRLSVPAVVAALVAPSNPDDPLWVDGTASYFAGRAPIIQQGAQIPAFVPMGTMQGAMSALFPEYWVTQQWLATAEPTKITRDTYQRAINEVDALRDEMLNAGFLGFSPLPDALNSFATQYSYNQTTLVILLLQIAAIALFYVVIVGAMIVERQAPETALLRSRGASPAQLLGVTLAEGLVLAVPCAIVAPFLAVLVTRLLGLTPAFHNVTGGSLIPAHVDALAFALAALGALLAVLALLVPAAIGIIFGGPLARRQIGRPRPALVQRYYVDLALAAICGMLLWELSQRGAVFKTGGAGGLSSDPLLLLSPALLTLAIAALALRVYPPALRLAARLSAAASGVTVVSGLRQLTRNPAQYTRLGLLLMMGVAVGAFAASYSDTTTRSFRERVLYQAGTDIRGALPPGTGRDQPATVDTRFGQIPGVARASGVTRLDVELGTPGAGRVPLQLLAFDPDAARQLLWFRNGLAGEPLATITEQLGKSTAQIGKPLPGQPVSFGLWANVQSPQPNTTVWARVRDATGAYQLYQIGTLDFSGWQQLTGKLSNAGGAPAFPVSLVAIVMTEPGNQLQGKPEPVYFDDFSVTQPDGTAQVVEDFEQTSDWRPALTNAGEQDEATVTSDQHHGGLRALRFSFPTGTDTAGVRGFYVSDPNVPLPAVVSTDFARETGLKVGGVSSLAVADHLVPIRIQAIIDLFPTLDPRRAPYVLLNRSHLIEWLNRLTDSPQAAVNEVWLQATPGADRAALMRTLQAPPYQLNALVDRAHLLTLNGADPLLVASGSGVLFLSFVAALALVAGAFLVTLFNSLRRRQLEFAVMTTLGLGRRRVFGLLVFEFAIVSAVGAAIGVVLGLGVSRFMMSFLSVTETGEKVQPPFVLVTNWSVLGIALGALAVIVALSIALAAWLFTAGSPATVLREAE